MQVKREDKLAIKSFQISLFSQNPCKKQRWGPLPTFEYEIFLNVRLKDVNRRTYNGYPLHPLFYSMRFEGHHLPIENFPV